MESHKLVNRSGHEEQGKYVSSRLLFPLSPVHQKTPPPFPPKEPILCSLTDLQVSNYLLDLVNAIVFQWTVNCLPLPPSDVPFIFSSFYHSLSNPTRSYTYDPKFESLQINM